MAITNVGYDGTINEVQWAGLSPYLGQPPVVAATADLAVTIVAGVDRTVRVAVGKAYAFGVLTTNSTTVDVQVPILASGTRWDAIVVHRDWQTTPGGTTTITYVTGTSAQQDPAGLANTPGVVHDQVIALVQINSGVTTPTTVVDRRAVTSVLTVNGAGAPSVLYGGTSKLLQADLGASSGTWDGGAGFGGPGASTASELGIWSVINGWCQASGTFEFGNASNGGYARNMVALLPLGPRSTQGTGGNADGGATLGSGYRRRIGSYRYLRADDTQSLISSGDVLAAYSYGWIGLLYPSGSLAPLNRLPVQGEAMQISLSYPV